MTVKTRVILIPFWIEESLKRAGLPVKECVDYQKVKRVVSTNDMLTFLAAQELVDTLVGNPKALEYPSLGSVGSLSNCWAESIPNTERTVLADAQSLYTVTFTGNYLDEVKSRLFTEGANGPDYNPTYEKPFIIYDLMPDVVGIVVYPGYFSERPGKELQLSLVEAVQEALYVYNTPYHEVASTPWFKRYLDLLAAQVS